MAKIEGIKWDASTRFRKGRRGHQPTLAVVHWSAGWGNAAQIATYFRNPMRLAPVVDDHGVAVIDPTTGKQATNRVPRLASYHFAIGRDGEIVQLVATDDTAWHAGGGVDHEGKKLINERSIGISFANRGPLKSDPRWVVANPDRVFIGYHQKPGFRGYGNKFETFTVAQITAFQELLAKLKAEHPMLVTVCGHEDLVKGKGDPGPVFNEHNIDWNCLGFTRQVKDWKTGKWTVKNA